MLNQYSILLEHPIDYVATVMQLPGCQAHGATREEALEKVQQLLHDRLRQAEIVSVSIELPSEHPWMKFAGMFKDDPNFDQWVAAIATDRRELDAEMAEYPCDLNEDNAAA
jgi:uncharacterized protein (DUF2267 family)